MGIFCVATTWECVWWLKYIQTPRLQGSNGQQWNQIIFHSHVYLQWEHMLTFSGNTWFFWDMWKRFFFQTAAHEYTAENVNCHRPHAWALRLGQNCLISLWSDGGNRGAFLSKKSQICLPGPLAINGWNIQVQSCAILMTCLYFVHDVIGIVSIRASRNGV